MKKKNLSTNAVLGLLIFLLLGSLKAEDGYRLWLRYDQISSDVKLKSYREAITEIHMPTGSVTMQAAAAELKEGLSGLLGKEVTIGNSNITSPALVVGTPQNSELIAGLKLGKALSEVGEEGYLILTKKIQNKNCVAVVANSDVGALYGAFNFLKLLQTHQNIASLAISNTPKIKLRLLNHWDNLDRYVERGYAGASLWDWHRLPDYTTRRYTDYARANASIGINGTVLTNVNANAWVLTEMYLLKVKALADIFRPYGIKVYLTARFSAPVEIGGLETADPLEPAVRAWWKKKADEIYSHIPDFGGFLVKANSEGQPGPQNYGRNHADGANMLAEAVGPHGGNVMWRAFVYSDKEPVDRAKQAYNEFKPLDGKFEKNVLIQVKNGPIDFQPREPFHPMFGAFPNTPLMMEFQITQEYLGFATHLAYLAPLYKEVLDADTYAKGKGSTVGKIIDGSLQNYAITGMAGVSNIGSDRNWCGHQFAQANWYAFGRLAWDHTLTSEAIADDWLQMTFNHNAKFIETAKSMMMASREAVVSYMTPLGLHHLMGRGHHYGPGPWVSGGPRADWTSVYYHRADAEGIGFDRSASGSNAIEQYFSPVRETFGDPKTCPDKNLLWFHHLPWDYKMRSGRTLWEELCFKYHEGVLEVQKMREEWNTLEGLIDDERFQQVKSLLKIQHDEAIWWRNASLLYFQTFSKREIPEEDGGKPKKTLEYYMSLKFPYAPGN